jgi:hypothetical protein
MTEEETIKIVKVISEMADHCCKGCAEALVAYFIKEFPEHKQLAIDVNEFYKIFAEMEKNLESWNDI